MGCNSHKKLPEGVIVHNEPGTWPRYVKQMKYVSLGTIAVKTTLWNLGDEKNSKNHNLEE